MKVARLYFGSLSGSPLGPAAPFHGYAILHPQGVTLVDTGFGEMFGHGMAGDIYVPARDRTMSWVRRTTVEALSDHGIEPGDVKYIINTHLGDHSGDNHRFPEATFIVQKPEVDWHRASLAPLANESRTEWDFPGAKLEMLNGEDATILPGVRCMFTPGHTPGHQAVVLEDGAETTLFVGDAVYTTDVWDTVNEMALSHPYFAFQVQAWNLDEGDEARLDAWRTSADRLKAVDATTVHFAHDRECRKSLPGVR